MVVAPPDSDPDFTDAFCAFLQLSVANVDAAELLLLLKQNPDESFDPRELIARLTPMTSLSEADVARHLGTFLQYRLVVRGPDQRFAYRPGPADEHVRLLERLYIERPVTLFRVIYALRDAKIKTFADAFRLRG
jgi:hypothetical protein